jgi:hypothetical protein
MGATLILNFLGIQIPLFVPFVNETVNAVLVIFVGSAIAGFYVLESLHTGWRATKTTAKGGASVSKQAGNTAINEVINKLKSAKRDRSDSK